MATQNIAGRIRAIRGISPSAIGAALIISVALWITVVYLSHIPSMIATCIAEYIGIMAQ